MTVTNMNALGIDIPEWEQLAFAPTTGVAGTCLCDDNHRYIYTYFQTSTTGAAFWRYDTWYDCWQQLASPPTQTGSVASMFYNENVGGQWSGKTYGSIYLFNGNTAACYLYKYDIATNTWSAALSTTNVPATFGTDAYLMHPGPQRNAWQGGYHAGVLRTISLAADIATGATTATVAALPEALVAGTRLRFGAFSITLSALASKGAISLSVNALPQAISAGAVITTPSGYDVVVSAAAAAGATSLSVYPLIRSIQSGTTLNVEQYVVLTASAAAAATSIAIAAALFSVSNGSTALYYGNAYLIGNNATQMYRYNIGTNAWSTTSANAGNPALPALPGTIQQGCAMKWLPTVYPDKFVVVRGGGTANMYLYDLAANTASALTFYPTTEGFTTGTCVASRSINGKQSTLLIQKDNTMRVYELNLALNTVEPKLYQYAYPTSSAVVGDRSCCLTGPDGIEYYYILLHSMTAFLRALLVDQ